MPCHPEGDRSVPSQGTPRVYITSLGCKLNQSEVESWVRSLTAAGCTIVDDPAEADLCVLNSCAVTHVASRKSRQMVRHMHRLSPVAQILVTGCYADVSAADVQHLDGSPSILNNTQKHQVVEWVLSHCTPVSPDLTDTIVPSHSLRTRALVKIQDGCDNSCSYCIVRIARGRHRSRAESEVLQEIAQRCADGYREIVLTGVHIGAYGRESGGSLGSLVKAILANSNVLRVRLSSIEPWDLDAAFLELWRDRRLCRHLHLPLQSGCDTTLVRMNRHYTAAQFQHLVDEARDRIPDLAVTTDVIVGFPGEDDAEFAQSASFVQGLQLSRIHIFPFSARPGTPAATMPQQVRPSAMKARVQQMKAVARASSIGFRRQHLGRTMDVLWEAQQGETWTGLTDNYIRVQTDDPRRLHNQILATDLTELTAEGMAGVLVH
jgi:threonylcarbamoyladenosine tRNA methylthiotransferase MtaB